MIKVIEETMLPIHIVRKKAKETCKRLHITIRNCGCPVREVIEFEVEYILIIIKNENDTYFKNKK